MKNFGEALKENRLIRNLTLKEIQMRTGINNGSLSRWERNEVLPSIDACITLANLYNISLEELLGLDEGFGTVADVMGDGLTSEERKLIAIYKSLSSDMRDTLWSLLATWSPETSFDPTKLNRH